MQQKAVKPGVTRRELRRDVKRKKLGHARLGRARQHLAGDPSEEGVGKFDLQSAHGRRGGRAVRAENELDLDEAARARREELLAGALVKVAPLAPVFANADSALGFSSQLLWHLIVLLGRYLVAILAEVAKIFLQLVARASARLNASARGQVGFPAQGFDHLRPVVAGDFPQVDKVRTHLHLGHVAHRKHERLNQKAALILKAGLRAAATDPFGCDKANGARLKKIGQLAGELGRRRE